VYARSVPRPLLALLLAATFAVGCSSEPRPSTDASAYGFDAAAGLDRPDVASAPEVAALDAVEAGLDADPPCRQASDCAGDPGGALCHVASGQCVRCLASADACPITAHCDDGTHACVAGCRADEGCVAASDGGVSDASDGAVTAGHCDLAAHACVACLETAHCPSGTVCVGRACVPGCSDALVCTTGRRCCGGGCVDEATDIANCGACGRACAYPHAAAVCAVSACAMGPCEAGYADCDRDPANGCEVDTRADLAHCGACGRACTVANATPACRGGVCAPLACNEGFGDCDGDPANGCETNLYNNQDHCGACVGACTGGTLCNYNRCAPAICCADLHGRLPALPSGVYPLQGSTTPYTAYCDMTTDGGGWTLVLTVGSAATDQLTFAAEAWTDVSVVNGDMNDPSLDITRRNQGFFQVPVLSEMKVCLGDRDHCVRELFYDSSTQSVFLGPERLSTHAVTDYSAWGYAGGLGCGRAGFNVTVAGGARCRYGVLFDRGATCGAGTDSGLGIGCRAGNGTGISAGQGDGALPLRRTRAWVWVR
jgi:hypothetical protein